MGTQKNRLDETVLFEHPKHMFKLMDKKIIAILRRIFLLNWPYAGEIEKGVFVLDVPPTGLRIFFERVEVFKWAIFFLTSGSDNFTGL